MPGPVKIYDRPERAGLSPTIIAIIVAVLLVAGYFAYRAFVHPPGAQLRTGANVIHMRTALWQEGGPHGPARQGYSRTTL